MNVLFKNLGTNCTKYEVFYYGFLQYMWLNPQLPAQSWHEIGQKEVKLLGSHVFCCTKYEVFH